MNRRIITIIIALAVVCGGASAQPKVSGASPVCEKRGYDQRIVIDTANVRVLYALNAKDIKDENTYIDLGKLEVGKHVKKYSSEFVDLSDVEAVKWKKETGHTGYVPKSFWMGGRPELHENWSELVFSDYIIRGNQLKEYACFPLWAERENSSYTEPWPLMQWTLADEQQTILGHRCQKATCRFRGRDFVAWFAADVPIKGGPWKFGGLPGCILKVYDVQKIYVWEAVAIERGTYKITQYPDKLYPKSTRKSVWQRQIKYNEDYLNAIGWMSLEGRPTPKKIHFEPLEKE
jgi:GLPGLI family protein